LVQALANTVLVVAALTFHGEAVTWCLHNTAARPWVPAPVALCRTCCAAGECVFTAMCTNDGHVKTGWVTAAALATCCSGDLSLLRRLMRDHAECEVALRTSALRDEV
jgi:hypothetical protein